jgi:hypothetical protein
MAYERNGRGVLVHTPDLITLNKHTPPLIRQLVALLLKHQDALTHPGVRTIYIHLHERPDPVVRLSCELLP